MINFTTASGTLLDAANCRFEKLRVSIFAILLIISFFGTMQPLSNRVKVLLPKFLRLHLGILDKVLYF